MADLVTDTFRKYQETGKGKWRGKPIHITKSKTDYSSVERTHPDDALNQEYLDAGAAEDHERPLCIAIHSGEICKRSARRGTQFCWKGKGDA